MTLTQRGGWPYGNPPNTQFQLNRQSPQSRGLVGWWPTLGSGGRNRLQDYSGYRDDVAFALGATDPTWVTSAPYGIMLDYDGGDQLAAGTDLVGRMPLASPWSATACAEWESGGNSMIFGIVAGAENISLGSEAGDIKAFSNGETAGNGSTLTTGAFYHTALVYDGADFHIYVNGVLDYSVTPTGANWQTATTFYIGSRNGENWTGQIGEVRAYNRALSAAEVWVMYGPATRWELYAPAMPRGVTGVAAGISIPLFMHHYRQMRIRNGV